MIRWQLKFMVTEFHLILALVLGVHLGALVYKSANASYVVSSSKEEVEKKKVGKAKDKPEDDELTLTREFKRKPFVITYMGNLKARGHSQLLSLLNRTSGMAKTRISDASQGVGVEEGVMGDIDAPEVGEFHLTKEQKRNLLRRFIKQKMAGVETCKRKHLLEDEFLMGTIQVNMKIKPSNNLARPKFKGHGDKSVIHSLEECIKTQFVTMSFPREFKDQEVSFDFRIN